MELEIRHLKLIAALDQEGTQTRAARKLFLTQSALSHQLTDLERKLGTPLFNRVGRRLTLTRAGRRVLEASRDVLPHIEVLSDDLRSIADGSQGTIRITTQCYTCYNWLPRVLPAFRQRFPGIEVQIVPDASSRAIASVRDGETDVALAYDFENNDQLTTTDLWTDELVAIVHPSHPLGGRPFLEARDFAGEHLLLHAERIEETYFSTAVLEPAGVTPKRTTTLRLTEGIVAMVSAGVGLAVLTRWTVARQIAAGDVVAVPVTELGLRRNWQAVRLAAADSDLPLQQFAELLRRGPMELLDPSDTPGSASRVGAGSN